MHSPVNFIVANEITQGRIGKADARRFARQSKPAPAQVKRAPRFQGLGLLRRTRVA